ncbi:MAG: flagellar filament capping protein FliD [Calditrichaeota bacterium]|nr:flagellar filament capping protein FliD [Calditrichota bacterium]MCB9366015.1 flagellar filament capping protein FliD [Calditrichota bacterium]MCB9391859.1 flagellar filament capping protein FliD [Calditrichota bacterium]
MSQPATSVSGLVSGIDWDTTIKQLMQIERRRVDLYETRKSENETKLSLWGQLQGKISALQGAAQNLDRRSEFVVKSASSSDSSVVTVQASSSAPRGSHSVEVLALAKAHSIAAQGLDDKNSTGVGDSGGDFIIQVGDETITIADADLSSATTLEQLRDLINNSADNENFVTASILDDGSDSGQFRLVLSSNDPGLDHRISFSSNPTNLNFSTNAVDNVETGAGWSGTADITSGGTYSGTVNKTFVFTVASGGTIGTDTVQIDWTDSAGNSGTLSIAPGDAGTPIAVAEGLELTFDAGLLTAGDIFSNEVFTPTLTEAQDANVRVDGIYVTHSGNTLENFFEGVTLNLLSAEVGKEVTITIDNDKEAMKSKIQVFVDAYNSVMQDISTFSAYDEENDAAAPLIGDGFLSSIRGDLSSVVAQQVGDLPSGQQLRHLADLGILSSSRNLLSINQSELDEALNERFEEVVNVFSQSFESGDNKIGLVTTTEKSSGGTYSLVVDYGADGRPVSATIDGVAATVDGLLIRGAEGTALEGVVLSFTPTTGGAGTVDTTIRIGKGITEMVATTTSRLLDDDSGAVTYAIQNLENQNENLDRQIASWERRLETIEESLRRQYSTLETLLSKMRNQSNYLAGVLG